jgi:solute:Na+ symporter, SSS family
LISYTFISILLYFVLMLAIGIYAMRNSTADNNEYLLGGRNVSPKVTALSAGASDMSGWMLMGLPGAAFISGLDSIWLAIGLVIGAYVNYLVVAPRLRVYTEVANDSLTIPEFFSKRFSLNNSSVRIIASAVIIFFFTLYTSSGLVAGGKLFESGFGYSYELGVIITVSVVIAYTVLGGFLAVSMTDFVQGCIMFIALIMVPLYAMGNLDGLGNITTTMFSDFGENIASKDTLGWLGVLSLMTWGLGYFGQPHIIVRFMAINSHKDVPMAKRIGMSWMTVTIIGAVLTGIVGLHYTQQHNIAIDDPETIFVLLSQILFHPLIAGWLLAAILAAIMSTVSSQLLVSSSSLVEDVYRVFVNKQAKDKELLLASRLCVVVVAAIASWVALSSNSGVLDIVSSAWAGFGAAFGPVVLFALLWRGMTNQGAIAGVLAGAITVIFWKHAPVLANGQALSSLFYELLPGFIMSSLAIYIVSKQSPEPSAETIKQFDETNRQLLSE